MHEIVTQIEIHATAPRVWAVLTDFQAYGLWNPLIASIDGTLAEGAWLRAKLRPEALHHSLVGPVRALKTFGFRAWLALNAMKIVVRVNKLRPEHELRWEGTLPVPGMFEAEHYFLITDRGDGTVLFTQGERFVGLLEPAFREVVEAINLESYNAMNLALKRRAEAYSQ